MSILNQNKNEQLESTQRILQWDTWFPYDLWWRKKYKLAFGCAQHKEMEFPHMLFELAEHVEMLKVRRDGLIETLKKRGVYSGDRFAGQRMNEAELDDFMEMDLSEFDDKVTLVKD